VRGQGAGSAARCLRLRVSGPGLGKSITGLSSSRERGATFVESYHKQALTLVFTWIAHQSMDNLRHEKPVKPAFPAPDPPLAYSKGPARGLAREKPSLTGQLAEVLRAGRKRAADRGETAFRSQEPKGERVRNSLGRSHEVTLGPRRSGGARGPGGETGPGAVGRGSSPGSAGGGPGERRGQPENGDGSGNAEGFRGTAGRIRGTGDPIRGRGEKRILGRGRPVPGSGKRALAGEKVGPGQGKKDSWGQGKGHGQVNGGPARGTGGPRPGGRARGGASGAEGGEDEFAGGG